ncbi:MAG: ATP-binding protein [Pseudomonadales bacterium]
MSDEPQISNFKFPVPIPKSLEWERLELLCQYLGQQRQGKNIDEEQVNKLAKIQAEVQQARQQADGFWGPLAPMDLPPLAYDVLACAVAPILAPQIGWLFQNLQMGNPPQPYPSQALIHQLLMLDPQKGVELYQLLEDGAILQEQDLIETRATDPYHILRPTIYLINILRGCPDNTPTPPGSHRVKQNASWEDLILPSESLTMLQEYLFWIHHREKVVKQWQGRAVGGPVALFAGSSGTGKTFAATVLAKDLGWPLYRVDLGSLVSKYIGETEENLNRLFNAAHNKNVVLQFDEADSLFGKRGEIKDARDRYANMAVSHLLTRIESHQGPVILTTNLRDQMDAAFIRRFQVVINFPRPDATARSALWRTLLPSKAPLASDIDFAELGKAINLTGGRIGNAALHAAYLAAGSCGSIGLKEIAIAVWREFGKDNYQQSLSNMGFLGDYLPRECWQG